MNACGLWRWHTERARNYLAIDFVRNVRLGNIDKNGKVIKEGFFFCHWVPMEFIRDTFHGGTSNARCIDILINRVHRRWPHMVRNTKDYITLAERIMRDCGFNHHTTHSSVLDHFYRSGKQIKIGENGLCPRFSKYEIAERYDRMLDRKIQRKKKLDRSIRLIEDDLRAINSAIQRAKRAQKECFV